MLIFWITVFIASLVVIVKGADWFLDSAEKIGLAAGLSPFIVGVVIVGFGTSLPELISSIAAVIRDVTEIVPANAVGSNITNILLVVGLAAIVGKKLTVTKSLIDLDIPLLAITTALFVGISLDGTITLAESVLLVVAYGVYLSYTIMHEDDTKHEDIPPTDIIPSRSERRKLKTKPKIGLHLQKQKLVLKDFIFLVVGVVGLIIGAKYLIESVVAVSEIVNIGAGVIALAAVAFGTSLPEILVSVKAAWKKKSEVALGTIFGSNVFNILVVVGIPGLFKTLTVGPETLSLGIPMLIVATLLFTISGISRRIHMWEGSMYLLIYIFFIGKLFGLF